MGDKTVTGTARVAPGTSITKHLGIRDTQASTTEVTGALVTGSADAQTIGIALESADVPNPNPDNVRDCIGYASAGPAVGVSGAAIGPETDFMFDAAGKVVPWTTGNVVAGKTGDKGVAAADLLIGVVLKVRKVVTT